MQKKTINTDLKKTGKYFFLLMLIALVLFACGNDDAKPKGNIIIPSISIEPDARSAFRFKAAQSSGSGAAEAANIDQIPGGVRSETRENNLSEGGHVINCDGVMDAFNKAPQAMNPFTTMEKLAQNLFAQSNFLDCAVQGDIEQLKKIDKVTEKEINTNTKEYTAKWSNDERSKIIKWVVNKETNTMVGRYVDIDSKGAKTLVKAKVTEKGKEISSILLHPHLSGSLGISLAFFRENIKTATDGSKFKEQEVYGRSSFAENNNGNRFINEISARYIEGKGSVIIGNSCTQGIPLNDYTVNCTSRREVKYFDENQNLSTTNTLGIDENFDARLKNNLKALFPKGSSEAAVFSTDFEVSLDDKIIE